MNDDVLLGSFAAALAVTVALLAAALALAHRHQVRGHVTAIAAFVVSLLVALGFAEEVGRRSDFDETPKRVHLPLASLTLAFVVVPIVTGIRHWRGGSRRVHVLAARAFLALVAVTIATGLWMMAGRRPKVDQRSGAVAAPAIRPSSA